MKHWDFENDNLNYEDVLKFAGAEILAFKSFGDFEGTWAARINYNGVIGWTFGSYGSCSACDALQGEFDYRNCVCFDHRVGSIGTKISDCKDCAEMREKIENDLKSFARVYLESLLSTDKALSLVESYESANEISSWIREVTQGVST